MGHVMRVTAIWMTVMFLRTLWPQCDMSCVLQHSEWPWCTSEHYDLNVTCHACYSNLNDCDVPQNTMTSMWHVVRVTAFWMTVMYLGTLWPQCDMSCVLQHSQWPWCTSEHYNLNVTCHACYSNLNDRDVPQDTITSMWHVMRVTAIWMTVMYFRTLWPQCDEQCVLQQSAIPWCT